MTPNPETCDASSCARNRERLLESARQVFVTEGYRASMDAVAERAGVVKQTLYNHFGSKHELFAEVIRRAVKTMLVPLDAGSGDLRGTLVALGKAVRQAALSPEGIALFRVLAVDAPRFPELSAAIFAAGPEHAAEQLARFLGNAMRAGRLRRDNPQFAADMLFGMLVESERMRRLHGAAAKEDEDAQVAAIVDCFLRAFAPNSEHINA